MEYAAGIIYGIIIILQVRSMLKSKSYGELAAYAVIITLAILYTYCYILEIGIPSPVLPFRLAFRLPAKLVFPDYTE